MTFSVSFFAKKLISTLITPPVLPLLPLLLGLLLWSHRPRAAKWLLWGGFLIGLFLCTPAGVDRLVVPLESFPAASLKDLKPAQAIVILAGGQRRLNEEYGGAASVNSLSLERIRYGAYLARHTGLPLLLSGGAPTGYQAESVLMQQTLHEDFHVDAKWIEARSLDTEENARYSAQLLRGLGIQRVALVTHAAHMRRARAEFVAEGIEVIPAPLAFFSHRPQGEEFFDFVPNESSAYAGWYAVHEWLGILAQQIRFALK